MSIRAFLVFATITCATASGIDFACDRQGSAVLLGCVAVSTLIAYLFCETEN